MNKARILAKIQNFILPKKDYIGIDIGSQNVKLVQLKFINGKFALQKAICEPISVEVSNDEVLSVEKIALTTELIKKMIKDNKIIAKNAITSISGNSVIVRFVKFPKMTDSELKSSIHIEAEPYIPFDINEVEIAYKVLEEVKDEGQVKMDTVLVAAKKSLIDEKINIIKNAGLYPSVIDVDAFAIETIAAINGISEDKTIMFINIGAVTTNIIILENGISKIVRDVNIGTNDFTNSLKKQFQLGFKVAEELKNETGLILDSQDEKDVDKLQASEILTSVAKDIVEEIHRSINYYQAQTGDINISCICLSGGGAVLKNLDKYFSNELDIAVHVFDPFENIEIKDDKFLKQNVASTIFTVATGLATRNIEFVERALKDVVVKSDEKREK